jgi:hypothetical protein
MSTVNFVSSGNPEEDEYWAAKTRESLRRRELGMCPNGCPGSMKLITPTHRECEKCGFGDFSNKPWPVPATSSN